MPLAQLPPGARGYLAAEQQAQETGQRNLAGLTQATQLRGALQKMQQEQQMRAELAAADTPEKQQAAALKWGGPQAIISHLDRKSRLESDTANRDADRQARLQAAQERIAAQIEAARQRGEDQRTLMQMQLDGRRQMAQLAASLRQPPQPQAPVAIIGPDGKPMLVDRKDAIGKQPASTAASKPPTDTQSLSRGYANRMIASEKIMSAPNVEKEAKPGVIESSVGVLPMVGKVASNLARPETRQQYRQAQEDWVRAKLRKESGAVIGDEEMDREIRVYFPQIGDSPKVIKQKKDSRAVATQAMLIAAGETPHAGAAPVSPANVVDFGSLK